jgi:hypothetical protein
MACEHVTMPGGGTAIVCGARPRKRCACGRPATLLCDWKVPGGTCHADLCSRCTTSPAPDKDLCRMHAQALAERQAHRALRQAVDYVIQARTDDTPTAEVLDYLQAAHGARRWTLALNLATVDGATYYLSLHGIAANSTIDEQALLVDWSINALAALKQMERAA